MLNQLFVKEDSILSLLPLAYGHQVGEAILGTSTFVGWITHRQIKYRVWMTTIAIRQGHDAFSGTSMETGTFLRTGNLEKTTVRATLHSNGTTSHPSVALRDLWAKR